MRFVIIILTIGILHVSAAGYGQRITLSEKSASLEQLINKIRSQSGYDFLGDTKLIRSAKAININVKDANIEEVLEIVFEGQALTYSIDHKIVVIKEKTPSFLEKVVAAFTDIDPRGKILDQNGAPLAGATVTVKGTNRAVITGKEGEFNLSNVPDDGVLIISYVGYKPLEISLKDAKMPLEIKLDMATGELKEVDITYNTGYQKLKPNEVTGSITHVTREQLQRSVSPNILDRLDGITQGILFDRRNLSGSGNDKIEIRGTFTFNESMAKPLIILDQFPFAGNIVDIDPNTVESIDILKDAAAASIWGAKAGNGVIVITTNKGRENQKPMLSFNSNLTITRKPNLRKSNRLFSSSEYIDIERLLFDKGFYNGAILDQIRNPLSPVIDLLARIRNGTLDPIIGENQINALKSIDVKDDYLKYVYNERLQQQYSINIKGGVNRMTYSISGSFTDINADQNLKNNTSQRIYLNSNTSYQPLKSVKINIGIGYISANDNPNALAGISTSNYLYAGKFLPYLRLVDENGNPAVFERDYKSSFKITAANGKLLDWTHRPLKELEVADNQTTSSAINLNIGTQINLISNLNLNLDYNYQQTFQNISQHYSKETYFTRNLINTYTSVNAGSLRYGIPNEGILDFRNPVTIANNARLNFTYSKSWTNHAVSLLAGADAGDVNTNSQRERTYGYGSTLTAARVDLVTSPRTIFGTVLAVPFPNAFSSTLNRQLSYYANGSYTLNRKYTISGSARKDASNIFGLKTNEKGSPFWSIGTSWDIAAEKFYKFKLVPNLNVRLTHGYSGNYDASAVARTVIAENSSPNPITNLLNQSIVNYPNPYLRWERVATFNAAVDFGIIHNRINGSLEYWRKKSTDLLANNQELDPTTGFFARILNSADIKGYGYDFSLNSVNLQRKSYQWTTALNFAFVSYKTETSKQPVDKTRLPNGDGSYLTEGFSHYAIGGYKWAGLDPKTGDPQGYINGIISKDYAALSSYAEDFVIKGVSIAPFYGNFLNTITYNGISMSSNIIYQLGHYFRRTTINTSYANTLAAMHSDYSKRWQKMGDEKKTDVPSIIFPSNSDRNLFYQNAEINLESADHIVLNDLVFTYTAKKGLLKNMPFRSLNISAQITGLNCYIWKSSKYDPLKSDGIPTPLTAAFKLNLTL